MALSNIGREPRREITESLVGIVVMVGGLWVDYRIASYFDPYHVTGPGLPPWWLQIVVLMIFIGIVVPMFTMLFLFLTHAVGEVACDILDEFRIDPRPKQRY